MGIHDTLELAQPLFCLRKGSLAAQALSSRWPEKQRNGAEPGNKANTCGCQRFTPLNRLAISYLLGIFISGRANRSVVYSTRWAELRT